MPESEPYRLRIAWPHAVQETEDPYSFGLLLGDLDLHLFNEGRHFELANCLGAQSMTIDGVSGVRFAVWAPNAQARRGGRRFQFLGSAAASDAAAAPRRRLGIVRSAAGAGVALQIRHRRADGGEVPLKADPVARQTEPPPATASIVPIADAHRLA